MVTFRLSDNGIGMTHEVPTVTDRYRLGYETPRASAKVASPASAGFLASTFRLVSGGGLRLRV